MTEQIMRYEKIIVILRSILVHNNYSFYCVKRESGANPGQYPLL